MAKSVAQIAEDVQDKMRRQGVEVLTIKWPDFYDLADRTRIKEEFQKSLSAELGMKSLLISYGQAVVVIAKDFNFSPMK
jgi:hypothetical protein